MTSYRVMAARAGGRVVAAPGWERAVKASAALRRLRANHRKSMLKVVHVLALAARADSSTAPTWPVIIEKSGLSRSTVARHLGWLHLVGLLLTLENGSTERFRGRGRFRGWGKPWSKGRARGGNRWNRRPQPVVVGNRAAVYLLIEPLPEVDPAPTAGPSQAGVLRETPPRLSRSERRANFPTRARARPPGPGTTGKTRIWDGRDGGYEHHQQRGTKGQQRTKDQVIAAALRSSALDLRGVSEAAIRSVIRPFTAAGWDAADLRHAIDHRLDGAAWTYASAPSTATSGGQRARVEPGRDGDRQARGVVRESPAPAVTFPAGWLRWRLAPWAPQAAAGAPGPAAALREASRREGIAARAASAARRTEAAAARAASVSPTSAFAAARATLAARAWKPVRPLGPPAGRRDASGGAHNPGWR